MFRPKFLYSLLELPIVYVVVTNILGLGGFHLRKKIFKQAFPESPRNLLDVGCGPIPITPEPLELLVGLDINRMYIRQFTGGPIDTDPQLVLHPPPSRKRLGYVASGDKMPFLDGSFDEIRSVSFFHHLPNDVAETTLREMWRCLKPNGRLVMVDMVRPVHPWLRPIAWFVVTFDRGRFVRKEAELVELFQKACPGPWQWKRYTYTYTGLELLCLQLNKP